MALQLCQGLLARPHPDDAEPVCAEVGADQLRDVLFVLDEEDRRPDGEVGARGTHLRS
jgi:hypothetical protein